MPGIGHAVYAGAAVTKDGEAKRQLQTTVDALPSASAGVRVAYGKITKVDTVKALVKAIDLYTSSPLANGKWIPLTHSGREIAERFGKIRKGMVVYIQYTGADGANATATVIRDKGEKIGNSQLVENTISQGLYKIFAPGIGLG